MCVCMYAKTHTYMLIAINDSQYEQLEVYTHKYSVKYKFLIDSLYLQMIQSVVF